MKIKRRWKVMIILPMLWCLLALTFGIPLSAHGYEAWIKAYGDSLLLMGGWFLGTITGVLLFTSALDVEERENKENKFKDKVYEHYGSVMSPIDHDNREDEAVNKTAIHFDIAPSHARNIVKEYQA